MVGAWLKNFATSVLLDDAEESGASGYIDCLIKNIEKNIEFE